MKFTLLILSTIALLGSSSSARADIVSDNGDISAFTVLHTDDLVDRAQDHKEGPQLKHENPDLLKMEHEYKAAGRPMKASESLQALDVQVNSHTVYVLVSF